MVTSIIYSVNNTTYIDNQY